MKFCTLCRRAAVAGMRCSHDGSPLSELAVPELAGAIPRYRVVEVAAQGDTGTVYRAQEAQSGRTVGLKLVSRELGANPSVMDRVRRETKNMIKLANPHVARVLECGELEGQFFVVREWLDGHPLSVIMGREGPMSITRAAAIAHQLCTALDLVHRIGLVHRDLKPNHVFLSEAPDSTVAKLIDTAIAAPLRGRSRSREVAGTAAYIAPEQAEGKLVSFRSDLYSLGALLFHMLVGRPPYEGTEAEMVDQHLSAPPPAADQFRPDVPPPLARLIETLMARQPASRPFSAATVHRELEQVAPDCTGPIGSLVQPAVPAPVAPVGGMGSDMGMAATMFGTEGIDAEAVRAAVAQTAAVPAIRPAGAAVAQTVAAPAIRPVGAAEAQTLAVSAVTTPSAPAAQMIPGVATPPPSVATPLAEAATPLPSAATPLPAAGPVAGSGPGGGLQQRTILGMPGLPQAELARLQGGPQTSPSSPTPGPAAGGDDFGEYGSAPTVAANALPAPPPSGPPREEVYAPTMAAEGLGSPEVPRPPVSAGAAMGGGVPGAPVPMAGQGQTAPGWGASAPAGVPAQSFSHGGGGPGFAGGPPAQVMAQPAAPETGWSSTTKLLVAALIAVLFMVVVAAVVVGALVCSSARHTEVPHAQEPRVVLAVSSGTQGECSPTVRPSPPENSWNGA
jgi:serine/threonine-protein kinase